MAGTFMTGAVRHVRTLLRSALLDERRDGSADVLMWHHGRCGSSVLGDLLDQHPGIFWGSELFEKYARHPRNRVPVRHEIRAYQRRAASRLLGVELKGLPCQHPSFMHLPLEGFLDVLEERGFGKAIYLDRQNLLLKLVSVQIVDQGLRRSFHARSAGQARFEGKLTLDTERVRILGKHASLTDMLDYIAENAADARRALERRFDTLSLTYEGDIRDDPTAAFETVATFLGVAPFRPEVRMHKTNTRTLPDLIENYDEVETLLASGPHAWMLESGPGVVQSSRT